MTKRLKIVDEFSKTHFVYKNVERNIYYVKRLATTNGRICIRKVCPITKKIYNKGWSLTYYTFNEALCLAKRELEYINTRKDLGLPLKYYTIKYWIDKDNNKYKLL